MFEYIVNNSVQLLSATVFGTILGVLIKAYLPHLLAKSRDTENFNRNINHQNSEKNKVALSLLGELANGILKCWEEASFNAEYAQKSDVSRIKERYTKVSFSNYEELKKDLVSKGVFTPNIWFNLDNLPVQINEINTFIETGNLSMAPARLAHFANLGNTLWNLVANTYVQMGGDIKNLTLPMPVKYERYGG